MDIELLITLIEKWGKDRGLDKANPHKQLIKLQEEVDELKEALKSKDETGITDAIGDIFVVLVQLSVQTNRKVEHCIEHAWNEIKYRKGKMIDGTFVKEVEE